MRIRIILACILIYAIRLETYAQLPLSNDLLETGAQQRRDLSIPGSRIVLNPYNFRIPPGQRTPMAYSSRPTLPLNVGYLGTKMANRSFEDLIMLHVDTKQEGHSFSAWSAPLSDASAWQPSDGARIIPAADGSLFASTDAQASSDVQSIRLKDAVTANLDEAPYLNITVPDGTALWAVKVHGQGEPSDRTIRHESTGAGAYCFDLRKATGWRGKRTFYLTIFLIGKGTSLHVTELSIRGVQATLVASDTMDNTWEPHRLAFEGRYLGNVRLRGFDFFYDDETIVRQFSSDKRAALVYSGKYEGKLSIVGQRTLVIQGRDIQYAVSFEAPFASPITFYRTYTDLLARKNPLDIPPEVGYWSVQTAGNDPTRKPTLIACSFAELSLPVAALVQRAERPALNPASVTTKLRERRNYWNSLLAKVPHPTRFGLNHVNPKGVTDTAMRKAYYRAWVFLAMNVLPPDTAHFPYPQIVTGKPSLWSEGHPNAPFSAAWESFIAIQLYGYLAPEVSWDAFSGLMSLVDEEGVLGGESLPSRKAETALLLYRLTGDKEKLALNYPALKRYMMWRIRYPMWVYKDVSVPSEHQKDADFVVSAIIDMEALAAIATILELHDDHELWVKNRLALFDDYLRWFWSDSDELPVQLYNTRSGLRTAGHPVWVTSGLAIDLLKPPHLNSMMDLFDRYFDPDQSFAGFRMPKYPDVAFTVRGLLAKGYQNRATQLIECNIRDVMRSGAVFAEQYTLDSPPHGDGVRPSIFGMAQLIDFVLLLNGVDYLDGRDAF